MEIRFGGGRALTVTLRESDRMNVEGVTYATGTSITFYEAAGGDEATIFFPSRERMRQIGQQIVDEIAEIVGA
ncbi:MAG: hypothetical protein ABSA30_00185 [Candidatus Aminicenantales bacterium]|jgi:hypothetical protein